MRVGKWVGEWLGGWVREWFRASEWVIESEWVRVGGSEWVSGLYMCAWVGGRMSE